MSAQSGNEPEGNQEQSTGAPTAAPTHPASPDTGAYPCFALNCTQVFDSLKSRMEHAREMIMDDDHCAEYIHCLAPSQVNNEPKGLCTYARQSGLKEDQIQTHLRNKAEVDVMTKRAQGVSHHLHLTEVEREGYYFMALKINWFARKLLDRPASSSIWFWPTDDHANFFVPVSEVEAIYTSYQMRTLEKFHQRTLE